MSIISEALKKAEKNKIGQVILKTPAPNMHRVEKIQTPVAKFPTPTVKFSGNKFVWAWNWEAVACGSLTVAVVVLLAGLFNFPAPRTGFAFSVDMSRIASISNPIQTGFLTGKAFHPAIAKPAKGKVAPYRLTGITVSPDGSHYAIVNETVVRSGDYVDGAFVQAISNGEVVLNSAKGELKLHLAS